MPRIKMIDTSERMTVAPDVANDLVERGLATRDPRQANRKPKKSLSYKHRQMRSAQRIYRRKAF